MVKLDKIVLDVRGKKIELSKQEAQDLRDVLLDLLGSDRREIVYIPTMFEREPFRATPTWIYTPTITTKGIEDFPIGTITVSNVSNRSL